MARDYKREAAQQWTEVACGTIDHGTVPESAEYFAAIDHDRYDLHAPWLRAVLGFDRFAGRDVLEIGFGQGTDLMQFARGGAASVSGFDLSPTHLRLASRRFELAGRPARLRIQDAEARWPLEDASLDVVYSFGVLHHTPNPERALAEAFRCLRPRGTVLIALYHSRSLFALHRLIEWVRNGEWRVEGYSESFWRIENPAPGTTARPLVDRYSRREARALVADAGFRLTRTVVDHFGVEGSSYFKWIPNALRPALSRRWGWYVIVEGVKP